MTQVAMIFEREKQEALRLEREKHEEERKVWKKERQQIVIKMIQKGYSSEEILSLVSDYTEEMVEKLRKNIEKSENY